MDDALQARVVELETRLSFQEQALSELSDALAASRRESARMAELLERAISELRQPRGDFYPDATSEPPPPHY